jgi:hypothetical protein
MVTIDKHFDELNKDTVTVTVTVTVTMIAAVSTGPVRTSSL